MHSVLPMHSLCIYSLCRGTLCLMKHFDILPPGKSHIVLIYALFSVTALLMKVKGNAENVTVK